MRLLTYNRNLGILSSHPWIWWALCIALTAAGWVWTDYRAALSVPLLLTVMYWCFIQEHRLSGLPQLVALAVFALWVWWVAQPALEETRRLRRLCDSGDEAACQAIEQRETEQEYDTPERQD